MMTETEELVSRRDALKEALEGARKDVAAREAERVGALAELEAQRSTLAAEVAALQEKVDSLEATLVEADDAWRTATKEAAGAKAHLEELFRTED